MYIIDYIKKIKFNFLSTAKKEELLRSRWLNEHVNVNVRASTINTKYPKFKHIIPVDYDKCYIADGPFDILVNELKSYTYPQRSLNECIIITYSRGYWDNYNNDFVFNDVVGYDQVFAITNNDRDAFIISLKYC